MDIFDQLSEGEQMFLAHGYYKGCLECWIIFFQTLFRDICEGRRNTESTCWGDYDLDDLLEDCGNFDICNHEPLDFGLVRDYLDLDLDSDDDDFDWC
jgi:hypothetical protein